MIELPSPIEITSVEVLIGLIVSFLTLVVMLWGFGFRLGQLMQKFDELNVTVSKGFAANEEAHRSFYAKHESHLARLSHIEGRLNGEREP